MSYLVGAVFPTCLIVPQACATPAVAPEWLGRVIYFADFLLLATVAYGVQRRKQVYWRMIPFLFGTFVLISVITPLWTAIRLSLSLLPFAIMAVLFAIGMVMFSVWWRGQRKHFA